MENEAAETSSLHRVNYVLYNLKQSLFKTKLVCILLFYCEFHIHYMKRLFLSELIYDDHSKVVVKDNSAIGLHTTVWVPK